MSRRFITWSGTLLVLLSFTLSPASATAGHNRQRVLVQCDGPCGDLVAKVRGLGGEVTQEYANVEGFAAHVPADKLADVMAALDRGQLVKEAMIEAPRPVRDHREWESGVAVAPTLDAEGGVALDPAALGESLAAWPANYNFNNRLTGVGPLHAAGKTGQGIVVAIIDSGTANAPVVPALAGSVVGGESFVPTDPVASATSRLNGAHGTWVGSMIAAHANFVFLPTSRLAQALQLHSPESVLPCPGPPFVAPCAAGRLIVPMVGSAPGSKLYALKVFPSTGGGAPESVVLAAMDRAITLRRNFNRGVPSVPVSGDGTENNPFVYDSLKIDVVNMSLGGPTLFAARTLQDRLTQRMLSEGITIVVSAGNDGFAAMTGGSPGTGIGSLTVGAANTAVHERVLREVQLPTRPLGIGTLYRPTTHIQMAEFSSRGPTADGRFDPEVVANGFASFAQGPTGGLSLVSGTSFSGPTTAGAAALLRREEPRASAVQIRNSLILSANNRTVGDGSERIDQGRGFIDVPRALKLLESCRVPGGVALGLSTPSVLINNLTLGVRPVHFRDDVFSTRISSLRPGEVAHFFVPSQDRTDRFVVKLRNVTPALPADQQNQLFGDDLQVMIVDAPTSFAEIRALEFVAGDADFTVDNPQSGIVRVAVQGDSTNAGRISADLVIERTRSRVGPPTFTGTLEQGDLVPVEVDVPAGTTQVVFETFWKEDWGHYPTNDIDMALVNPAGAVDARGATLASPERVVVNAPLAGRWTVFIDGFTVNTSRSHVTLRVTADGVRLPAVQ